MHQLEPARKTLENFLRINGINSLNVVINHQHPAGLYIDMGIGDTLFMNDFSSLGLMQQYNKAGYIFGVMATQNQNPNVLYSAAGVLATDVLSLHNAVHEATSRLAAAWNQVLPGNPR